MRFRVATMAKASSIVSTKDQQDVWVVGGVKPLASLISRKTIINVNLRHGQER